MKTINAITSILASLFLVLIFNPYTDGASVSPFQFEDLSRSYTAIYVAGSSEETHYKYCTRNATMNSPEECKDEVELEKECGCRPQTDNVFDDSFSLLVIKCNNPKMAYCPRKFVVSIQQGALSEVEHASSADSTLKLMLNIFLALSMIYNVAWCYVGWHLWKKHCSKMRETNGDLAI